MRVSDLRYDITIEKPTRVQSASGELFEDWVPVVCAWASREEALGGETLLASQVWANAPTRFTIRHVECIEPTMRIRCGGSIYNIVSVGDLDGRRRWLTVLTQRVN